MHDGSDLVMARLRRARRERIGPARWPERHRMDIGAWEVDGEPVPVSDALAATYAPFAVGSSWGRPWGTTWFRCRATIPAEMAGLRVAARIDLGFSAMTGFQCEGLVWAPGPSGAYVPRRGLHPLHHDLAVSDAATAGNSVEVLVEAASNPTLVWHRPDPNSDLATAGTDPLYVLAAADLVVIDPEVVALCADLDTVRGLFEHLAPGDPRRSRMVTALSDALDALDLNDVGATADAGRAALAGVLSTPAAASAHRVTAVGHAHIDTAWLWPLRETERKCARTFANVDQLMDEYPELMFACSQAQQYAWIEERYPELFERIRARVAEGRWIPVGGMWVEADANLAGGEALLRQFIRGQRYFEDRFGSRCGEVWIPDVFGYPAGLPQIMRLAGIDRFLTQKLSWNETNAFPHHTFRWEGIDGSTVFTHFPPVETYNADFSPRELTHAVANFADHGRATRSLMPFGWGDGGGGPTAEMMERYRRSRDLDGFPRLEIGSPEAFFDQAVAEYPDAPRWVGELYFEKHRGTFTSQAATKAGNRRCERLLREAELFASMAYGGDDRYPHDALDEAWRVVLVNQFHDILPGSSIGWVHREAAAAYEEVTATLEALISDAVAALAGGATVVANATPAPRREVVALAAAPSDRDGSQPLSTGGHAVLVEADPLSVSPLRSVGPTHPVRVDERGLDNGLLSVRLDDRGHVVSLRDGASSREAIVAGAVGNVLQLLDDHPAEYDAWDISEAGDRRRRDLTEVESIEVVETGPLVGSIRVTRRDGPSTFVQTLVLHADSARLDVVVDIDWHHRDTLLKVAFPLDLNATELTREIQFGHYASAIHTNTSWDVARFEVCAHRWVSVAEPGFGVALLNDAKYGHDAVRVRTDDDRPATLVRMSLLRGTGYPDPVADEGRHRFSYAVMVHGGDPVAAGVVSEAYALAGPLRVVEPRGAAPSPVGASARGQGPRVVSENGVAVGAAGSVMIDVVKDADDRSGDLVVRCYESAGRRTDAVIELPPGSGEVAGCDIYEAPVDGSAGDSGADLSSSDGLIRMRMRPFQVRTLRIGRSRPARS